MIIDLVDNLFESGHLQELVRLGVVSPKILEYRKIWHSYNSRISAGRKKMQAIDDTCFTFDVSQRHVYNVLALMRRN
jgi:hypothetical protein